MKVVSMVDGMVEMMVALLDESRVGLWAYMMAVLMVAYLVDMLAAS